MTYRVYFSVVVVIIALDSVFGDVVLVPRYDQVDVVGGQDPCAIQLMSSQLISVKKGKLQYLLILVSHPMSVQTFSSVLLNMPAICVTNSLSSGIM